MSSPHLVTEVQRFVDGLAEGNAKPLYEMTPQQARQVLLDAQDVETAKADALIEDMQIPVGDGKSIPVRFVRPHKSSRERLPVVFYIHGGGWVMGDAATHDRLVRDLSVGAECAVVFPLYTPSPEAKYPQALNELFAVLKYIVKQADAFKFDTSKVVVAGDSVGGNMATVMAMLAKENNGPKLVFQLLFYPVADASFDTDSYNQYAEGPWLTKKAMQWFWDAYAPDAQMRREITASPLQADVAELEGLPPALIITAETDVLRDEGEAYARKLNDAKVDVASVRFNGTIHDFVMLNALAASKPTRVAVNLAITILRRIFYRDRV